MQSKNKYLALAAIAVACGMVYADEVKPVKLSYEERIAKAGGEVIKPGTFTGKVAIVSQQEKLSASDCEAIASLLARETQCNIVCDNGENASITLFLIDDPKEPVMLIAPEDHWGKLNMARIVDDLPGERAKQKFFTPRARKMVIKALSLLMGGGSSQFPGNIMNAATMKALDQCEESIPVDMVDNYVTYLKAVGVKPAEKTTYRKACKEGWAPAPTNEVQQAIWDKVHALPTEPLKIKPETTKQK